MLRAGELAAAETGADGKGLCGGDGEHGVREHGLELVEAGFAEARGDVADDAGDCAADAVFEVAKVLDERGHAVVCGGVGAAYGDEGVDLRAGDGVEEGEVGRVGGRRGVGCGRGEEELVADGGGEGDDFDAVGFVEDFFGDGAGGDAACG